MQRVKQSKNQKLRGRLVCQKGLVLLWVLLLSSTLSAQQVFQKSYGVQDGLNSIECGYLGIDKYTGMLYLSTTGAEIFQYDGKEFSPLEVDYTIRSNIKDFISVKEGMCIMAREVGAQFNRRDGKTFVIYFKQPLRLIVHPQRKRLEFISEQGHFFYFDWNKGKLIPMELKITIPHHIHPFEWQVLAVADSTYYIRQTVGLDSLKSTNKKFFLHAYQANKPSKPLQPIFADGSSIAYIFEKDFFIEFRKYYKEGYLHRNGQIEKLTFLSPITGRSLNNNFIQPLRHNENQSATNVCYLFIDEKIGDTYHRHYFGLNENKAIVCLFSIPALPYNLIVDNSPNSSIYWLSSHEGLNKVNTAILEFPSSHPNMVSALHTITEDEQGYIWFGSYGQGFSYFDGNKIYKLENTLLNRLAIMPGPLQHSNGANYYFYDATKGIVKQRKHKWELISTTTKEENASITGYYFKELSDKRVGLGLYKYGIGIADSLEQSVSEWKIIGKGEGVHLDNVLHITEDKNKRLWAGRSSRGVACYDPKLDTARTWHRNNKVPLSFGSMSGFIDGKDNLWLGTNKGLKIVPKVSEQAILELDLFEYAKSISLPSGDQSLVTFLDTIQQYLIIGAQQGIHFLDLHRYHQQGGIPKIYTLAYRKDISGQGSEQNAIMKDSKGFLWVGTQTGAARIDLNHLSFDTTGTTLQLNQLLAGDDTLRLTGKTYLNLPTGKRNIRLEYSAVHSPLLYDNIYFDCMLQKKNGDTLFYQQNTQSTAFHVTYLAPDDYEIVVLTRKNNLITDRKKLSFTVPKTLAESNAFWVALAFLISGLIGFAFWIRARANRQLLEQKIKIEKVNREQDKLQIQSVTGSLNPHFINNSLHWIGARYRKDEILTSMVNSLSKNILVVFKYTRSGKAYYTLEEEFTLVKNYLNICQKRFGDINGIKVTLPSIEGLEKWKAYPILIMQLQIHVENAIEHGLFHQRGNKHLVIKLDDNEAALNISIEDSGIGRLAAKEIESIGTQQGTKMLQEIILIYNQYNKTKLVTTYEDNIFTNSEGKKFGTRVILTLPKNYQYEIK